MKYLIQNSDGTIPPSADFSKTKQERLDDAHYESVARQMKKLFPKTKAILTDLECLQNSGAVAGDVVYCPHRLGEPALAWILRNPASGEAELLGSDKVEDLEWYMHFGHLELLAKD